MVGVDGSLDPDGRLSNDWDGLVGELIYDSNGNASTFDDRVLAHLQVVIIDKLRRGEKFPFTFLDEHRRERTLMMSPAVPLQFVYSSTREPQLNEAWLQRLAQLAGTTAGLVLVPES